MANERFDDLVKRIAAARLTRQEALRGLAGAAAAAAGAAFVSEETAAKKRGKVKAQQNGNGKVTICHCPPGNPDNCKTISVGSKAAAAHLRNHENDTEGECEEATTTTAEVTTTTAEVTTTTAEVTTTTGEVTTTTAGIASANRRKGKRRRGK